VRRNREGSDFTLADLRERAQPMSLYLSIPFGDQARLRPLTRLIVRQVLDYCTAKKAGWRHRLLGLIDELPALRCMNILSEGLDYLAGYGITLCLITSSLNTLDHLYGRPRGSKGCNAGQGVLRRKFPWVMKFPCRTKAWRRTTERRNKRVLEPLSPTETSA
jgi:type IV secretion system protein VirD4